MPVTHPQEIRFRTALHPVYPEFPMNPTIKTFELTTPCKELRLGQHRIKGFEREPLTPEEPAGVAGVSIRPRFHDLQ